MRLWSRITKPFSNLGPWIEAHPDRASALGTLLSAVASLASVGVATVAILLALKASEQQDAAADRQERIAEKQAQAATAQARAARQNVTAAREQTRVAQTELSNSTPLLAPGASSRNPTADITLRVGGIRVTKPADSTRFVIVGDRRFLVIPVRNNGGGVAVVRDVTFPDTCRDPFEGRGDKLTRGEPGIFVIRGGRSEQVIWQVDPSRDPNTRMSVLLRATDLASTREHWTCILFTRESRSDRWAFDKLNSGQRDLAG